ncbi:potassium ABC transporter ATPase [Methanolobus chelungpuianus]|uniref:Potassium ABC transporter ATPase n=2 Tax=Methanolobus chelungpuianus TaxID=502115 RepID=A0AAE3H901_9EURY|nr:potassium ABC transporter ATPase [Methanolobus chelungpuianus]
MQKRVAVVFDSAGTLLRMYRVAREAATGMILDDIQTTLLVALKPRRALVVMNGDLESIIFSCPPMTFHQFLEAYGVSIEISCSSGPIELDEAYGIIQKSSVCVDDLRGVISIVRGRCPDVFYLAAGIIVDVQEGTVPYVLSTGGRMYSDTPLTIKQLREMGADVFIASGDGYHNLNRLAATVGIPGKDVYGVASPRDKEKIILELKERYDSVIMVGDGMNDILALRAADIGIMTTQQGDERPRALRDAADRVIDNINEVTGIVKQVLSQTCRSL